MENVRKRGCEELSLNAAIGRAEVLCWRVWCSGAPGIKAGHSSSTTVAPPADGTIWDRLKASEAALSRAARTPSAGLWAFAKYENGEVIGRDDRVLYRALADLRASFWKATRERSRPASGVVC